MPPPIRKGLKRMAAQTQTRRILIKVDSSNSKALEDIASKMGLLNRNTKSLANGFDSLKNMASKVFGFSVLGMGIGQIVSLSDEISLLFNRIKVFTGNAEDAAYVMDQLLDMANKNSISLSNMAQSYSRLAVSTKALKLTQNELLILSDLVTKTFRLAGATAEETAGATVQLSQAFSRGVLRGQEFNSVVSQNALISELLVKKYGTMGQALKAAEKGLISGATVAALFFEDMKRINGEAAKLTPTIGQSLTRALNIFQASLLEVNKNLDVNAKFSKFIDNLIYVSTAGGKALTLLGEAFTKFSSVTVAAVTSVQPQLAPMLALLKDFADTDFSGVGDKYNATLVSIGNSTASLLKNSSLKPIMDGGGVLNYLLGGVPQARSVVSGFDAILEGVSQSLIRFSNDRDPSKQYGKSPARAAIEKKEREAAEALKKLRRDSIPELTAEEALSKLNISYENGAISVEKYYRSLDIVKAKKAREEFVSGKHDLLQWKSALESVDINEVNRQLNGGRISLMEFNQQAEKNKMEKLNLEVQAGTKNLIDYRKEIVALRGDLSLLQSIGEGANKYVESLGSTGMQVADLTNRAFQGLENSIVNVANGIEGAWNDMTKAILEDIGRIILRAQIIQPLAEGISSYLPSIAGAAATSGAAAGSSSGGTGYLGFSNTFAKGGIVDSPTAFTFGGGGRSKTGLMGEAGSEAILPLSRGSNGDLGVQAQVTPISINIINQSGAEIKQTESQGPGGEKVLDILITSKVKEAFASGSMDRTMNQAYGIRRKGN